MNESLPPRAGDCFPADSFVDFLLDQLADLGGLEHRRFFGGKGLVCRGVQFAMVISDTLYLVADDTLRDELLAAGGELFSYDTKKGRVVVKRFASVTAEQLEDSATLTALAKRSLQVAASTPPRQSTRVKKQID